MPAARRPQLDDRRRLVIYSQRFAADSPAQNARAQAATAALRSARKPAAAYGWRVQRRLRARWFGIVPVRRRTLLAMVAGILGMVAVLAIGHWASLWWPPVALRPELARPLRLDRPDSLGTWWGAVMLAAAAGGSLMVYQLRRYRADDYRGHYRLWRIAVVACLLASIDAVVHLVGWCGAAVDVLLAERDVLAGADWVRLLLCVGGAAFGLRITVELARSRTAAATMAVALVLLALSPAVRWNLLRIEPATAVTWLPIALAAGRGAFLIAVVIYLRMLYREVRKLEASVPLGQRLRKLVAPQRQSASRQPDSEAPSEKSARRTTKRKAAEDAESEESEQRSAGWRWPIKWRRDRKTADAGDAESGSDEAAGAAKPQRTRVAAKAGVEADVEAAADSEEASPDAEPQQRRERRKFRLPFRGRQAAEAGAGDDPQSNDEADDEVSPEHKKQKRFGLPFRRRSAVEAAEGTQDEADAPDDTASSGESKPRKRFGLPFRRRGGSEVAEQLNANEASDEAEPTPPAERRRFGLSFRRRAKAAEHPNAEDATANGPAESHDEQPPATRSRFGFLKRKPASDTTDKEDAEHSIEPPKESSRRAEPARVAVSSGDGEDDDSDLDPDGVDWDGMNKSERRRARKLLKRQGKAA